MKDNEVFIDPAHGGILHVPFCSHVSVLVDDLRVVGKITLTGAEKIKLWLAKREPRREVITTVSDDAMQVAMKVVTQAGFAYSLLDSPPNEEVHLAYVCTVIEPSVFTVEQLRLVLLQRGFHGKVDEQVLQTLCDNPSQEQERVVFQITHENGIFAQALNRSIRIEQGQLPLYLPDQWLDTGAVIFDSINETEQNVGRQIVVGGGAQVQNGRLVTTRKGRLEMTEHFIDVVSQLVFSANLAPPEGDLTFPGDVVINGSVLPGCHIEVAGQIVVHGDVTDSVLKADHGVFIQGDVTGSSIHAGPLYVLYHDIESVTKSILFGILQLQANYERIFAKEAESANPWLQKILLQACHSTLHTDFIHFVKFRSTDLFTKKMIANLIDFVQSNWLVPSPNYDRDLIRRTMEYFYCLHARLQLFMETEQVNVRVKSCNASVIRASGSIEVTGVGVTSSSLESGDQITVQGYVRGGFVIAKQSLCIAETGSVTGMETSLKVFNSDGSASIGLRHPHTLLEVGGHRTYNDQPERNIIMQGDDGKCASFAR